MQYLHRAPWKKKRKEIEGSELRKIQVSEAFESSQVKKIEGSSHQDPSVQSSIGNSFWMWILSNARTNGGKQRKSRSSARAPKQPREQIRATLLPGYYVSESGKTRMRILHQLVSCWMVPGVDYFSFHASRDRRPFSGDLLPRFASGALQRRPRRNRISRTLRRLPSYKIPDESTPQRSVCCVSHKKTRSGKSCCLLSCGVHLRKMKQQFPRALEGRSMKPLFPW